MAGKKGTINGNSKIADVMFKITRESWQQWREDGANLAALDFYCSFLKLKMFQNPDDEGQVAWSLLAKNANGKGLFKSNSFTFKSASGHTGYELLKEATRNAAVKLALNPNGLDRALLMADELCDVGETFGEHSEQRWDDGPCLELDDEFDWDRLADNLDSVWAIRVIDIPHEKVAHPTSIDDLNELCDLEDKLEDKSVMYGYYVFIPGENSSED